MLLNPTTWNDFFVPADLQQQIWRENQADPPMFRTAPQPYWPQIAHLPNITRAAPPSPYVDQTVPPLQMLQRAPVRFFPAYVPRSQWNTYQPNLPSSLRPSAAPFIPRSFLSPVTFPSVPQQEYTSRSPPSRGNSISSFLQTPQTFSSVSHPAFRTQLLLPGPAVRTPRVSFQPQTDPPPSHLRPPLPLPPSRTPIGPPPRKSTPVTINSPPRSRNEEPSLHPSVDFPQISHITRAAPTPRPSGHRCWLCKRDLAFNAEGPVSMQTRPPDVAVLPCGHTFHDDCLKKITEDDDAGNPPCLPCAIGETLSIET